MRQLLVIVGVSASALVMLAVAIGGAFRNYGEPPFLKGVRNPDGVEALKGDKFFHTATILQKRCTVYEPSKQR